MTISYDRNCKLSNAYYAGHLENKIKEYKTDVYTETIIEMETVVPVH